MLKSNRKVQKLQKKLGRNINRKETKDKYFNLLNKLRKLKKNCSRRKIKRSKKRKKRRKNYINRHQPSKRRIDKKIKLLCYNFKKRKSKGQQLEIKRTQKMHRYRLKWKCKKIKMPSNSTNMKR